MIRQNLPALSKVHNEAMKIEAEKQVPKKQPQKGDPIDRSQKESHITKNQRNVACDFHHHFGMVPGME
jgi:hypothetical protein